MAKQYLVNENVSNQMSQHRTEYSTIEPMYQYCNSTSRPLVDNQMLQYQQQSRSNVTHELYQHYQYYPYNSGTLFIKIYLSSFIQYCDSNIGIFSLPSYEAIALPTIATAIVVALTRS